MNIEIHTGVKAYWLGALIFVIGISAGIKIVAGLLGTERSNRMGLADILDGIVAGVICAGWWFAE